MYEGFDFSNMLFSIFYIMAILVGVKWCLIMVFNCIP